MLTQQSKHTQNKHNIRWKPLVLTLALFATTTFGFFVAAAVSGTDGHLAGLPTLSQSVGAASSTSVPSAKDKADCEGADLSQDCQIVDYLIVFINVLSAMVVVVIVGSVIAGGIQYTTAADDPQKVSAAKMRIFNALFAFIIFIFGYAFLQWVVPGGVLH